MQVSIAGITLDAYICNASGPNDTELHELERIASSRSGAIVMKTCTANARTGNPEPRYARLPHGSIQSMGLPNPGYRVMIEHAHALRHHGKPIIASIAGSDPHEYRTLTDAFQSSPVHMIEANLSCPNLEGSPVAYDLARSAAILHAIRARGPTPIGLKLPPYLDMGSIDAMADLISQYDIAFLTCINSLGNTLVIDPATDQPIIRPKGGIGALSGAYIKPLGLANTHAFHTRIGDRVAIFGVGGIDTGRDAYDYLLAGASAVQVGTAYEKEGAGVFARIERELESILEERGTSIDDARGSLTPRT